jgi:hypothetical protein
LANPAPVKSAASASEPARMAVRELFISLTSAIERQSTAIVCHSQRVYSN